MNKKLFFGSILLIFLIAGCSSGSRFSKEVLLSKNRISSIDKSFTVLVPNNWSYYEDNLNESALVWFINNSNNASIIITRANTNDLKDISLVAEIVKASKKQNKEYSTFSKTESLNIGSNKSAYFIMQGNSLQYVFVFQNKDKFYEIASTSSNQTEYSKEELFYLTKEIISSFQ